MSFEKPLSVTAESDHLAARSLRFIAALWIGEDIIPQIFTVERFEKFWEFAFIEFLSEFL